VGHFDVTIKGTERRMIPEIDNSTPVDEPALLSVAREVLEDPGLAWTDDLFDAGMTSLTALQLADRLTGSLGQEVTVADVYLGGNLEQILGSIGTGAAPESQSAAAPEGRPVPLSDAQQRFWIAEQFAPGAADNVLVLAYTVAGPSDESALREALAGVVRRHPALRTYYPLSDAGAIRQILSPDAAAVPIEMVDTPAASVDLNELAETVTAGWWDQPLPFERQPPLRIRLCRVNEDTLLLCLQIHHIAFDGRSEQLFLNDLALCYRHQAGGHASAPSPDSSPTVTHPGRERELGAEDNDVEFWRRLLTRPPSPFLPAPPEPADEAPRLELLRHVPAVLVERLEATTRSRRVPTVAALVAATGRACAEVFGVSDLCLGTVADGRGLAAPTSTIGYFVNPLAIPLQRVAGRDGEDLLAHTSERVLSAFRHAATPFDELVDRLRPPRGRHPWFQAWVALQYATPIRELTPGVTLRKQWVRAPRTATELSVEAFPQPDGWRLQLAWRADGSGDETVAGLADALLRALADLAELGPDR
jgi:condensation domain-containing protein/phosphopantetheine binding protein